MRDAVEFRYSGPVTGQARPRFSRATGRPYERREMREYKSAIAGAWSAACGGPPLEGPVAVEVHAYRPLPEGRPARAAGEPWTCRPDADNVAKAVLDALNGLAWRDDSQVVSLAVRKHDRERGQAEGLLVRVGRP